MQSPKNSSFLSFPALRLLACLFHLGFCSSHCFKYWSFLVFFLDLIIIICFLKFFHNEHNSKSPASAHSSHTLIHRCMHLFLPSNIKYFCTIKACLSCSYKTVSMDSAALHLLLSLPCIFTKSYKKIQSI